MIGFKVKFPRNIDLCSAFIYLGYIPNHRDLPVKDASRLYLEFSIRIHQYHRSIDKRMHEILYMFF
jgi:hypothetical protein